MQTKSVLEKKASISVPMCKDLGSLHAHSYNKKKLNELEVNYFIRPNKLII